MSLFHQLTDAKLAAACGTVFDLGVVNDITTQNNLAVRENGASKQIFQYYPGFAYFYNTEYSLQFQVPQDLLPANVGGPGNLYRSILWNDQVNGTAYRFKLYGTMENKNSICQLEIGGLTVSALVVPATVDSIQWSTEFVMYQTDPNNIQVEATTVRISTQDLSQSGTFLSETTVPLTPDLKLLFQIQARSANLADNANLTLRSGTFEKIFTPPFQSLP